MLTRILAAILTGATLIPAAHADAPDTRDVVQSMGGLVRSSYGGCVRTRWEAGHDNCVEEKVPDQAVAGMDDGRAHEAVPVIPLQQESPPVRTAATLADEERKIYFDFNEYAIRPGERNKLDLLATVLEADSSVRSIDIIGHADRIGTERYNDTLSQQRAEAIRRYMHNKGYLKSVTIKTEWRGEKDPITNCSTKESRTEQIRCLQPDRRADVEISFGR